KRRISLHWLIEPTRIRARFETRLIQQNHFFCNTLSKTIGYHYEKNFSAKCFETCPYSRLPRPDGYPWRSCCHQTSSCCWPRQAVCVICPASLSSGTISHRK